MTEETKTTPLANPAPLGLMGFGMTTVLLNIHNMIPTAYGAVPMVIAMGIFFGGLAQLIAGMFEFRKGNTFGMTAFISYGLFWLSLAAILMMPIMYRESASAVTVTNQALTAYLFMWGLFTMFMFVGTLKANRLLQIVFLTLFILFYLLALGHGLLAMGSGTADAGNNVLKVAGAVGIICGLSAIYLAMAEVINEAHGKTILPIFPVKNE